MPYDYKKLRAAREKMGWTKELLGKLLNVTGAAIGLIEKGERQSPPTIKAFAKKVRIPMDDIVISDEEFALLRAQDLSPDVSDRKRREPAGARR